MKNEVIIPTSKKLLLEFVDKMLVTNEKYTEEEINYFKELINTSIAIDTEVLLRTIYNNLDNRIIFSVNNIRDTFQITFMSFLDDISFSTQSFRVRAFKIYRDELIIKIKELGNLYTNNKKIHDLMNIYLNEITYEIRNVTINGILK
jgi:hypothetical protein